MRRVVRRRHARAVDEQLPASVHAHQAHAPNTHVAVHCRIAGATCRARLLGQRKIGRRAVARADVFGRACGGIRTRHAVQPRIQDDWAFFDRRVPSRQRHARTVDHRLPPTVCAHQALSLNAHVLVDGGVAGATQGARLVRGREVGARAVARLGAAIATPSGARQDHTERKTCPLGHEIILQIDLAASERTSPPSVPSITAHTPPDWTLSLQRVDRGNPASRRCRAGADWSWSSAPRDVRSAPRPSSAIWSGAMFCGKVERATRERCAPGENARPTARTPPVLHPAPAARSRAPRTLPRPSGALLLLPSLCSLCLW
jgi:hypothetical protein